MSGTAKRWVWPTLVLLLLVGAGQSWLSGQNPPPLLPPPGVNGLRDVGALPARPPDAIGRLGELGIRADSRGEIAPGPAGTYVRADSFSLDPDTGAVEATGNVVLMTIEPNASPVVAVRSDLMTFEQAFEPLR
jgi:hypothetical protein